MNKKFYAAKLLSIRATFPNDITKEERQIMDQHSIFWDEKLKDGTALLVGPVFKAEGAYGLGIITADSLEEAKSILLQDPANKISEYEVDEIRLLLSPYYLKNKE